MKKILSILVCSVLLLGITGCGSKTDYNKEYEEAINIAKSMEVPAYKSTVGELLGNALEDEYWDHFTGYLANGSSHVLISVKGKSKYDGKECEIVYDVDTETKGVKLENSYVDGEEKSVALELYTKSYEEIKGE